ncbi:DegT/DnrJ/EryC1/StrS family aminotransferase [Prevotella ihumii]|uniref:DegT/DnrJ/EryC1/StrS family aminotransferase n=1 Tax=Prevotella ihumii TaxID=1917878 RepID=UPI000981A380|nr:DegT/DnrJ/EryC1/StrS family aminotransferase [Prevotella ihumii]
MERKYLCLAHMSGNEMKYIQEAFDTNWVVPLGPNVNAFEEDLKRFVSSKGEVTNKLGNDPVKVLYPNETYPQTIEAHENEPEKLWTASLEGLQEKEIVALCSGTSAIHLALINLGVKAGDEVICQSFTFCASSHPVTYLGATPVFVDSERDTWNMCPQLLEESIKDRIAKTGKKPKAIIVVYLYGMPAKINEILEVAQHYDIPVVEDAAEGLGSRYNGQVVGTFGAYGVMSFNGNKMITTSGGGALICPNKEAKNRIMFFATQAREAFPYYQHEEIGYNYRLSNICAGIGRGQMTVLNEHIAHHQHLAKLYAEGFKAIEGITFHGNPDETCDSNFWLNTITLDAELKVKGQKDVYKEAVVGAVGGAAGVVHTTGQVHTDCEPNANVEAMRIALDKLGIESRPLWKPMHLQPVYKNSPAYINGISEELFKTGLCLPSGPMISDEDAQFIIEAIKSNIL